MIRLEETIDACETAAVQYAPSVQPPRTRRTCHADTSTGTHFFQHFGRSIMSVSESCSLAGRPSGSSVQLASSTATAQGQGHQGQETSSMPTRVNPPNSSLRRIHSIPDGSTSVGVGATVHEAVKGATAFTFNPSCQAHRGTILLHLGTLRLRGLTSFC